MMYVVSAYNNDLAWLRDYTDEYVIYNQGEPIDDPRAVQRPHRGADLMDKFSYIVDNYDNLPDVVCFVKGNLFKYISKEEFDTVCRNKSFTPLLTQNHKTYLPTCYYEDGMYYEINDYAYLHPHPCKSNETFEELKVLLGFSGKKYLGFAPGGNYIVPKENITQHSKEFYQKLISYLAYTAYSGEAQMLERGLWYIWANPTSIVVQNTEKLL